jgi:hypothetical protein
MFRTTLLLVVVLAASGCQTVLRFSHPAAAEGSFGNVRTMSVSISTAANHTENAVVNGLFRGEIPVPINVEQLVKERIEGRLGALGYTVCPAAPCGDGAMDITVTESEVGTELTSSGPGSHSRITIRVVVRQADGQAPYDFNFWDRRTSGPEQAQAIVGRCADHIAERFEATLTPGRAWSELPLEEGGALDVGVNLLLSSQWRPAITHFTQLTQSQPEDDGAWYDLGVAWEAEGDWSQALLAYERAAALKRKRNYLDAVEAARDMAPPQQVPQPMPTLVKPIPLSPPSR